MGRYHFLSALLTVFVSGWFRRGKAQILPGKLYIELYYKNPDHMSKFGRCEFFPHEKGCDVYFEICIWNGITFSSKLCDVGKHRTRTFEDAPTVSLAEETFIEVPLKKYPPPTIRLRVEAWDKDRISPDDHIVSFISEAVKLDSHAPFKQINLLKIDRTWDNEDVQIKVLLKLECALHYFGRLCEKYCKPDFTSYTCDSEGNRTCYPGFSGPMCNMKDYCHFEPCAPFAECKNNEDGLGRTCFCDRENVEDCYEAKDVCNPSPCLNGGVCEKPFPHSQTFVCHCKGHWYGPTCSSMLSSCHTTLNLLQMKATAEVNSSDLSVCENGGVCVDHPTEFSHFCQCPQGWKGETCQIPDWTATIVTFIFFGLILLACAVLLHIYIRRRKSKRVINVRSLLTSVRKAHLSKLVASKNIYRNHYSPNHNDECADRPPVSKFEENVTSTTNNTEAVHSQVAFGTDKVEIQAENNDVYDALGIETGPGYPSKHTPEAHLEGDDLYSEPLVNSHVGGAVEYRPPLPERSSRPDKRSLFTLSQNSSNDRTSKSLRISLFQS